MVSLEMKDTSMKCVLYGEYSHAKKLCSQITRLGVTPVAVVVNTISEVESFGEIPVLSREQIMGYSRCEEVSIIPAFAYHALGIEELCRLSEDFRSHIVRDIEFLAICVMRSEIYNKPVIHEAERIDILMALQTGFVFGGLEACVQNLFSQLDNGKRTVRLLESLQPTQYQYVGAQFYGIGSDRVDQIGPYDDFSDYVMEALQVICAAPPCIYVDNGSYRFLAAVWLAKKKLGLKIKVISVIYGELDIAYRRLAVFKEIIDHVVAMSEPIYKKIHEIYPGGFLHVDVKLQITMPCVKIPEFSQNIPLRLAYASRLEPTNKRSMWIIEVLDILVARKVNFTLDIAGDGDCFSKISSYIVSHGLTDRVRMLGIVPRSMMMQYWREHQVFLNFSKTEGGPLTLFESMGQGLVPVATEAGYGKRLIRNGHNGFVIDSPQMAANSIITFSQNPELLNDMRKNAWDTMLDFYNDYGQVAELFTPHNEKTVDVSKEVSTEII